MNEKAWSAWGPEKVVTADMISVFADVTDNHQWVHEDTERTRAESPYGAQIAHGLLLVALIPGLMPVDTELPEHRVRIIRGFERLRLTSPVYPGESVHLRTRVLGRSAASSGKGTIIEREVEVWSTNGAKPAIVCALKMQYF